MPEAATISPQTQTTPAAVLNNLLPSQGTDMLHKKSSQPFLIQCKLTVGAPDDPYEKEADAVADRVMRMPEKNFVQRKFKEGGEHIQREEETEEKPSPDKSTLNLQLSEPDFLSLRTPFFERNAMHLWDPKSALGVWKYNYDLFQRFGLDGNWSGKAANLTAPFFINSQLKVQNPTWWEITDKKLNTNSIVGSLPIFSFDSDFRNWKPLPFLQKKSLENPDPTLNASNRQGNFIQRKCAECEEEEKVNRKPISASITPFIQTKTESNTPTVSDSLSQSIRHSQGSGGSMDSSTHTFMSDRFGTDFSDVKIHTDSPSVQMNRELSAKAFTVGKDVYFNEGQYQPGSSSGKNLLAHELTHVVQQGGTEPAIQKSPQIVEPDDSSISIYSLIGAKVSTKENIKMLKKIDPDATRMVIMIGTQMNVYDNKDKLLKSFIVKNTVVLPPYYFYVESSLFYPVAVSNDGTVVLMGKPIGKTDEEKKELERINELFNMETWFDKNEDKEEFFKLVGAEVVSFAVAPLSVKGSTEKDSPVLTTDYPDWFKELKKKVEARIEEERKTNKNNPNLPDKVFFYGSDKVQIQKGTDAWTIEVEKGKREAYLTVKKTAWDEAGDKDAYTSEMVQQLFMKVKLMADEAELQKEEEKEITQIDSTGQKQDGSKWGWAVKLKKQIEQLLTDQKKSETDAKDFPDKLSLNVQEEGTAGQVYLRVWVYKQKPDATEELPVLIGGTLPVALTETDKAADWIPIVRKAAAAIKTGKVTTDPNAKTSEEGSANGDPTVLPPYPAMIFPKNMNPDRTTATIASNNFRMAIDTAAIHGNNLLNLTLLHMGMNVGYAWKVYPLPKELNNLKKDPQTTQDQMATLSNEYTRKNASSLGDVKKEYDADFDWEQEIDMEDLGEGEFLVTSKAGIAYPEDWNMKRQASIAGLPITVKNAVDMASQSALGDTNAIDELKKLAEKETDPIKKKLLIDHIKELEEREKCDLLSLTRKDAAETKILIQKAGELKKFISDDKARKIDFSGNKEHDPFMFRLKAFDKASYNLYILIRQVFDYRYGDIYAIDEYTKLIQQQYDDLNKLDKRTQRMADNEKLRKDLPMKRCVAALVKKDDGNLVPLILLVGHHEDSDPANGNYKMMVVDVTFDSPKKDDMTYVGSELTTEKDAIHSAFIEFGEDNKYGNGKIVYRVANTAYRGEVDSTTTAIEYLGYALAVIGIALLIAGAILSAGTLAPASAAGIAGIVSALGIAVGVAGAVLAARNIYKRVEKGTFDLDAEFALDVVSIIGAFVQVVGTTGRAMANFSRTIGAVQKTLTVQRLDKLLLIYDAVELGGNAVLIGLKVQEDVDAVKRLGLSKEQEDEMLQQIALEAMQAGAMIAYASFSKVKDVSEHLSARIERSRYKSFKDRGWVDAKNNPTEMAPPFLKNHAAEPGKPPTKAQQGEQAWKETKVLDMAASKTVDQDHNLTVTERGRIIRCSDFCTDLRMKYSETLEKDPWMNKEMMDLETRAQQAAKSGNKGEAQKVADAAASFESKLQQADNLRKHLFGMSDKEIDDTLESMEAGKITGGEKSGFKIDDTRIPKRQRRQIDVTDIMTEAEIKELGKGGYKKAMDRINSVMGKKISDIPELKKHWDDAREEVLKGKEVTDYKPAVVIDKYKDAQRKFWEKIRKDPAAVEFLKKNGFELEGDRGAAVAVLGPQGKLTTERGNVTNQERRISLDHIVEKAQGDNWKKALDADNLELMFQNANSWKEIVQVKFGMREPETAK